MTVELEQQQQDVVVLDHIINKAEPVALSRPALSRFPARPSWCGDRDPLLFSPLECAPPSPGELSVMAESFRVSSR